VHRDSLPSWIGRVLRFRGRVVRRYGRPAPDVELLLDVLQQHGFSPLWVDNPFPFELGANRKRHLHDTLQNFNRRLDYPCIALRGDGSGMRFRWEEIKIGTKRHQRHP
jgi:hypothetical protein